MTAQVAVGFVYLLAAVSCTVTAQFERRAQEPSASTSTVVFWFAAGALLATMGLARSTGAAHEAEEAARRLAETEGWYDSRRPAQLAVVLAFVILWSWAVSFVVRRGRGGRGSFQVVTAMVVLTSLILLGALPRGVLPLRRHADRHGGPLRRERRRCT